MEDIILIPNRCHHKWRRKTGIAWWL